MMLAKVANRWVTPENEENGEVGSIKDFKPREVIQNTRKNLREKIRGGGGEEGFLKRAKNMAKSTI